MTLNHVRFSIIVVSNICLILILIFAHLTVGIPATSIYKNIAFNPLGSIPLTSNDKPFFELPLLPQSVIAEEPNQEKEESGEEKEEQSNSEKSESQAEEKEQDDKKEPKQTENKEQRQNKEPEEKEEEKEVKEKMDCKSNEHFDSEVEKCVPDKEVVCDDGKDNDRDSEVDSDDSDCIHNEIKEQEGHESKEEEGRESKVVGYGDDKCPLQVEPSEPKETLCNNQEFFNQPPITKVTKDKNEYEPKKSQNTKTIESLNNNTELSSLDSIENRSKGTDEQQRNQEVQNVAQNIQTLADSNNSTAGATDNRISINSTNSNNISSSTDEDENGNVTSSAIATTGLNFSLDCNPLQIKILQGSDGSITCSVQNKIPKPIELTLECSGLEGTGIECFVNGDNKDKTTEAIVVGEMSEGDFSVHMTSSTSTPPPEGLYPFTISADCSSSEGQCG